MNRSVRITSENGARIVFFRGEWLWDLGYAVFARFGPTRRLSQKALELAGSGGLSRLVAERRPDVIVSVFPQTTEVLGRLRARGRLAAPVCACVTDLGGLWYWATPGADVHLVTHPESIAEVRRIAGRDADVRCVHGFTDPAFLERRDPEASRRSLGLPPGGKVVVYTGLLPVTQTETALAIVLGHEITHAVAGHGRERMSQQLLAQGVQIAGDVALGSNPASAGIFNQVYAPASQVGVLLPYARKHEYEADHYGLIFAAMAGYDPREAIPFWQRMAALAGAGQKPPILLSDHPADADRIAKLQALMPEAMKYYNAR